MLIETSRQAFIERIFKLAVDGIVSLSVHKGRVWTLSILGDDKNEFYECFLIDMKTDHELLMIESNLLTFLEENKK